MSPHVHFVHIVGTFLEQHKEVAVFEHVEKRQQVFAFFLIYPTRQQLIAKHTAMPSARLMQSASSKKEEQAHT
jgi:hypothetical protein